MDALDFIHDLDWNSLPDAVRKQAKINLMDLIGVGIGGAGTKLSAIIRDTASQEFGGSLPMFLDERRASASGVALAAGMTIDALDGHDGFNPAKGHIGCPVFAAILPAAMATQASGQQMLEALAIGYEIGARTAMAQHATVPDYHTSGSWGAVAGAAAVARLHGLSHDQTRHALGIAEYHGPRSQMMRCIDHPTMVKDGSGWGAMTAVSAVAMAQRGFTGAPALTVEQAPAFWGDLGQDWHILGQYYKPYPVCRWAQAPVRAVLELRARHGLNGRDVDRITVTTFHESIRLATAQPETTEEAQYSTSFPCAVAMARGQLGPADIADDALNDAEVLRLSRSLEMVESDKANALFPNRRIARIDLHLFDGRTLSSDWVEPEWDPSAPPSQEELEVKFRALAAPVGDGRAERILEAIDGLDTLASSALTGLICQPINR